MPQVKSRQEEAEREFNMEEAMGGGRPKLILLDVSSSMAWMVNGKKKIDMMAEAMSRILDATPRILIAFDSQPVLVETGAALPCPSGSTALHLAIDMAADYRPDHTLIISDGQPDSAELAFASARMLKGVVDTLFIGDPHDYRAKQFLRDLAYRGRGRPVTQDMAKGVQALQETIQGLLSS